MKTVSQKNLAGFSLIELMVTVSIISTLSVMAIPTFNNLQGKAKEAEAVTNLRGLSSLAQSYYFDESDRLPATASYNTLIKNVYTSATSCSPNNVIGFKVSDCRKIGYVYGIAVSDVRTYGVYAVEGGGVGSKRVFKKCGGTSFWTGSVNSVNHPITPSSSVTCQVCWNIMSAAMLGTTNLDYDINGDGLVTLADNNSLAQHFAMFGAGNPMPHLTSCP